MAISNMVIPTTAPLSSMSSMGGTFGRTMDVANNVPPLSSNSGGSGLSSLGSSLLSGGIGAAGSLLSGFINNIFAMRAQKRQFKYNTQLMNIQNALQRDLIQDDALLKLQGYKKAGLSTASLGGSFGNPSSVPVQSVGSPQGSMPDMRLGDIFNAARQVKLQEDAIQSQINLNNANAESALANARNSISESRLTDAETYLKQNFGAAYYEHQFANMDANTKESLANTDKLIQDMWNSINITDAELKLKELEYQTNFRQLPKLLRLLDAQTAESYSRGEVNRATAKKILQESKNLETEGKLLSQNYKIGQKNLEILTEQVIALRNANDVSGLEALRSRWQKQLMNDFGYDWWKAKQITDETWNYVDRFISTVGNAASSVSGLKGLFSNPAAPNGSVTTSFRYGRNGEFLGSTKTQFDPIVRNK